jgi:formylglycine-generating enzyme required for sulfatase activity
MAQTLDISGSQINGARDYQEDAFLVTSIGGHDDRDGAALVIVADGMGGHAAGNVASNMAVQTFNKHVTAHYPTSNIPQMLQSAVRAANASITETVRETPALRGMGCTLVAALVSGNKLYWVSVGDSHLYVLRDRELSKKNVCHSYGGFLDRMAAAGRPVEPEAGFSRNMLMSALSGDEIAEIDCPEEPYALQPGDRIVLSTDGLDSLNAAKIQSFSDGAKSARDFVGAMLKAVEDAAIPRQDNTTVVVIDMPGRSDKPGAAPVLKNVVGSAAAPTSQAASAPAVFEAKDVPRTTPPANVPSSASISRAKPEAPRRDPRDAYVSTTPWGKILTTLIIIGAAAAAFVFRDQIMQNPTIAGLAASLTSTSTPPSTPAEPAPQPAAEPEPAAPTAEAPPVEPEPAAVEPAPAPTPPPPPREIEKFADANGPAMVWVPAGTFEMGSSASWPDATERPRHSVTLKRFAISRNEITISDYSAFRNPPNPLGLNGAAPVVGVTWNDAVAYTKWLSARTGKKYRLPTEAEWEYAAAAGSDPQYWPWGRNAGSGKAHCFGCSPDLKPVKPVPVGSFEPNAFGLYDTSGNAAEWTEDCWIPNYEGAPSDGSARTDGECKDRVVRGGSFEVPPKSIRSARRDKWPANRGHESIGFRVVREE